MKPIYTITELWASMFIINKNNEHFDSANSWEEAKSKVPLEATCFSKLKKFNGRLRLMKKRNPPEIKWVSTWPN